MMEEFARSDAELVVPRAEPSVVRAEPDALQTEIVRRVAAQQDAERRYRDLFQRTDVGLAAIGLNGLILDFNAAFAATLGVENTEDLRGRRITAFTHLDDRADDADVLTTLSLGARHRAWIIKRRLDGARHLLLYHLTYDASGEPATIVVRDASELLPAMDQAPPGAVDALASLGDDLEAAVGC